MEKVNELADLLIALPESISGLQIKSLDLTDKLQDVSDQILDRESEIKTEINAAVDSAGKKLYSNEESRKIAFVNDSKKDTTLSVLYQEQKSINREINLTKIEIEKLSNQQRNTRSVLAVFSTVS